MPEGFVHKGRTVFAVRYRLECPRPQIMELVVPLDQDGNALRPCPMRPAYAGRRIVQVHPGDRILHGETEYTVQSVEVYRSLPLNS